MNEQNANSELIVSLSERRRDISKYLLEMPSSAEFVGRFCRDLREGGSFFFCETEIQRDNLDSIKVSDGKTTIQTSCFQCDYSAQSDAPILCLGCGQPGIIGIHLPFIRNGKVGGSVSVCGSVCHILDPAIQPLLEDFVLLLAQHRKYEELNAHINAAAKGAKEAEYRMHLAFQNAPLAYHSLDENACIIAANNAWYQLFAYEKSEIVGKPFADLLTISSSKSFNQAFAQLKEKDWENEVEMEVRAKSGDVIIVSIDSRVARDMDGGFKQTHCVLKNITDKKRAEIAMRSSQERLELAFHGGDMGMWDWDIPSNSVTLSPQSLIMFGSQPQATIHELEFGYGLVHPDDVEQLAKKVQDLLHGKILFFEAEYRVRHTNGHYIWVNDRGKIVEHDQEGKPLRAAGIYLDVTSRKEAEEALRESEERFRNLFERASDALFLLDFEGRIVDANQQACESLGYTRNALLQLDIGSIEIDYNLREMTYKWQEMDKASASIIGKHRRKDATEFPVEILISLFEFRECRLILLMARDITERAKAEEKNAILQAQLLQAQKMECVGQLAGGIAHDFNNLLSPIIGYADMGMIDAQDPAIRSHFDIIRSAGTKAKNLTRQLLAFGRKQLLEFKVLNLTEQVYQFEKMLRRIIRENIQIQLSLEPAINPIKADPSQIEQVLLNLAINAHDAMPDGGTLLIKTANAYLDEEQASQMHPLASGDYVMLTVSDTGCGVTPEQQMRLFEPFFTTKDPGKGTGLGLSTVYGIVEQHGGHIWAHGQEGKGMTFSIYLPRYDQPILIREPEPAIAEGIIGGNETILVVEDEEAVRLLAQEMLSRYGYNVLIAESAEEALWLTKQYDGIIHVLLTDIIMPGMNGMEMADLLMRQRPRMCCIFMSGYADNAIDHKIAKEYNTVFIQKPFTVFALMKAIRDLLAKMIA